MKPEKNTSEFLAGGGEMGEFMRNLDWSKTPVGPIDTWPQSLKTVLSLLLNSKFPMFLWWGPDLTCFYNDAYRPSLGQNGKHPSILGTPAKEAWAEIWHIISPLIEAVLETGEATWFEDQLVPIFRNGHIEDVYWTFSYSPVVDDSGKRAGVFVTCTETTGKVALFKELEESNKKFLNNIMQAPVAMCIFRGKNHVVEIANERMLELWGKNIEQVINKPIFEGLPEVKGQGLEALVGHVYGTGERFIANERPVALPRNGKIETVYVNFTYEALREPDGIISGIVATATDVSQQVLARHKIEESERDIRNMVLQAPIGICIVDAATLVSEIVNDSFIEVAGKPYEEIAGKHYWDTFAEAKPYYESAMASVIEDGKSFFANEVPMMLIRHGKEEQIYVTFVYAPLKTSDGKVNKVAVWVLENTSQVVARQKIGEAEERLRLATDAGGIATFDLDLNTDEIIYSNSLAEIFGFDIEKHKHHIDLRKGIHEDDRHLIVVKAFDEAMHTGTLLYEARVVKSNDAIGWIRTEGKVFYDHTKKPTKLIGTIRDITEEKSQEQKLRESEKKLNIVIEASELGVWEMDLKTEEVRHSDRYLEIFGYSKNDKVAYSELIERIHPDDRISREKMLKQAFTSGGIYHRHRLVWTDNSIHWIESMGKVFYNERNTPTKLVGTVRDITQEKRREYELLESEVILDRLVKDRTRQLERSNEDLQQFAHVASHDLKEPLRKIKMYTSRIEDAYADMLPPKALEFLTEVTGATTRMQMMIDGVLSFSTINSTEESVEKVNLNKVINDIKGDLELIIEQKNATLLTDELPEIEGAGILLYQLFYNLVSNSLKFSKHDVAPVIKISSSIVKKEGKEYVKFLVSDNGIGFDQYHAEQIFTTFVRLNSKDNYEGTGLGLSLCRKITERHGGTIEATGIENKGATFTIMLPLVQSSQIFNR